MTQEPTIHAAPANTNDDPYESAESALEWLYLHRRKLLEFDPATMSFSHRRRRQEALKQLAAAEKLILADILPR